MTTYTIDILACRDKKEIPAVKIISSKDSKTEVASATNKQSSDPSTIFYEILSRSLAESITKSSHITLFIAEKAISFKAMPTEIVVVGNETLLAVIKDSFDEIRDLGV